MLLRKSIILCLSICILFVNSEEINDGNISHSETYSSHINSVLNYLNAKPNKLYAYKKGSLINAQNRADIVEVTIEIDVDCINKYPEIPCNEHSLICNAFIGQTPEKIASYEILSDVRCSPKFDSSVDEEDVVKVKAPVVASVDPQGQNSKIELSNEAMSPEQEKPDFIATRAEAPCLGCPFDLNPNAQGVDELIYTATKHIESERNQRHKVTNIRKLQQQIVNGVKYILVAEFAPTTCPTNADMSAPCPLDTNSDTFICEINFIQQPWIHRGKHIINNNCTVSQEFAPVDSYGTNDAQNEIVEHRSDSPSSEDTSLPHVPSHSAIDEDNNAWLADLESQILTDQASSASQDRNTNQIETSKSIEHPEIMRIAESLFVPQYMKDPDLKIEPLNADSQNTLYSNMQYTNEEPVLTIYQPPRESIRDPGIEFTNNQDFYNPQWPDVMTDFEQVRYRRDDSPESKSSSEEDNVANRNNTTLSKHPIEPIATTEQIRKRRDESAESSSSSEEDKVADKNNITISKVQVEQAATLETVTLPVGVVKRETSNSPEESSEENKKQSHIKTSLRTKREAKRDNEDSSSSSSSEEDEKNNNNNNEKSNKIENSCESKKCKGAKGHNGHEENNGNDSSSSSSSSDEEKNNHRHKRSIGQMEKISHEEKSIVRDLATFAASTLDSIDEDHHKRVILQILGAKKLKLDGIYYQIILRLGISHCLEGDHHESCREKLYTNATKICKVQVHVDDDYSNPKVVKSQCQNIKKDANDRNRTNYSRYRRRASPIGAVGAPGSISNDDSRIQPYIQAALTHLDSTSQEQHKLKVINVISATSQVVAGQKYVITVNLGLSDCKKDDESKDVQSCGLLDGHEPEECVVEVWERIWLNSREYTVKCPSKVHNFKTKAKAERRKREIDTIYRRKQLLHSNIIDEDTKKYVKIILEYLSSKTPKNSGYELKKIRQVTKNSTQVHINLDIALCQKVNLYRSSFLVCPDIRKYTNCDLDVFDQRSPGYRLNMKIKCSNDDEIYTYIYNRLSNEIEDTLDVQLSFNEFVNKYRKIYYDEREYKYRFKVFSDNLNKIDLLNKYEQGTAVYGITQFADMTEKEFSKSRGYRADLRNENDIPFPQAQIPNIKLPDNFDWRSKNAVTEVKNQGMCGSCWAFSVTGNVEGQYAIKHGKLLEFSEQELVDCDKSDEGCNGGLMDNAYRAIEKLGGLEGESDYPYEGDDETCHFNSSKIEVRLSGAVNISHDETDMAKWLVQNGPISIAINANAMQFYFGGVSHPWKALCSPDNLDHGVLIVGYGVKQYNLFNRTMPYWIVKNSWGTSWGEQGYYRVYRGDGTCGLNQTPSSAIVE